MSEHHLTVQCILVHQTLSKQSNSHNYAQLVIFSLSFAFYWKVHLIFCYEKHLFSKMALSNVLILSQIAGHVVVLTLSLCILVPMLCHVRDFNGHCLLFSTGDWNENNGLFDVQWVSEFYCNFTIITGMFLFFVSSIEIYRWAELLVINSIISNFISLSFLKFHFRFCLFAKQNLIHL